MRLSRSRNSAGRRAILQWRQMVWGLGSEAEWFLAELQGFLGYKAMIFTLMIFEYLWKSDIQVSKNDSNLCTSWHIAALT
jgi:hypothetical protein